MVRRMTVVDYSAEWPSLYERELALLREALGDEIVHAHHIGSTAVPGLAAKPVIDILLEVQSVERLDSFDSAMKKLGYQPHGEFGIPGRRYYPKGGDDRTHHVHAFAVNDPHIKVHLAFRDYLRTHPAVVAEYAAVKREGAMAHETDPEGYVAFKHDFVERIVAKAIHWAEERRIIEQAAEQEDSE
ncbi:GrpB family protein [Candidatus Bipolaricaulota bacterium]